MGAEHREFAEHADSSARRVGAAELTAFGWQRQPLAHELLNCGRHAKKLKRIPSSPAAHVFDSHRARQLELRIVATASRS